MGGDAADAGAAVDVNDGRVPLGGHAVDQGGTAGGTERPPALALRCALLLEPLSPALQVEHPRAQRGVPMETGTEMLDYGLLCGSKLSVA